MIIIQKKTTSKGLNPQLPVSQIDSKQQCTLLQESPLSLPLTSTSICPNNYLLNARLVLGAQVLRARLGHQVHVARVEDLELGLSVSLLSLFSLSLSLNQQVTHLTRVSVHVLRVLAPGDPGEYPSATRPLEPNLLHVDVGRRDGRGQAGRCILTINQYLMVTMCM